MYSYIVLFVLAVHVSHCNSYSIFEDPIPHLLNFVGLTKTFQCNTSDDICLNNPAAFNSFGRLVTNGYGHILNYDGFVKFANSKIMMYNKKQLFQGVINVAHYPNINVEKMWHVWINSEG